jgi:hypothetical protein
MEKLTATLAFGYGVFRIGIGILLAIYDRQDLAGRYFAAQNTGEVIDKGFLYLLFGIVMGILCHIAVSVSRNPRIREALILRGTLPVPTQVFNERMRL